MPKDKTFKELRLILGDQLNTDHPWFAVKNGNVLYVLMEVRSESEYVTHHIQKIAGIFAAMRRFANWLKDEGHAVRYFKINDGDNQHGFVENLAALSHQYGISKIRYQQPDEWRLDQILKSADYKIGVECEMDDTAHFFTERDELANFFRGKKQYLMETFYRAMRKKHGVLMDGREPVSGRWNYDAENRNRLPKGHTPSSPILFHHDVSEVMNDIREAGLNSIGEIEPTNFTWPLDRREALALLDYFLEHLLPFFGKFQDALSDNHWSIYHSRLSFALNTKMISPKEVVNATETAWRAQPNQISLAETEGFIRQILGWREYMRGIYWAQMPAYREKNYFNNKRKLPAYFWSGDTRMRCVSKAVKQSLEKAYAHHIQRLMVTGNFALLAGVDPNELDTWYLGIYIDAFDWVEITNTRGMSQYADGGIVGTKPYISSGAYIQKMGDHCQKCSYNPKSQTGANSCPFNSLYWNFLAEHRDKLESNRRMGLMYRVWDKFGDEKQSDLLQQARHYLQNIERL